MKLYEKLRDEALDELKRLVYDQWEVFATTGKCDDIHCTDCPFGIGNCDSAQNRIRRLNEEVEE